MSRTIEFYPSKVSTSSDYEAALDAAEALGAFHAQHGMKPNASGLYGMARTLYFRAYRSIAAAVKSAA